MRGPRTILMATFVVTTGVGVSATILRAQQMRAGSAPIAASATTSATAAAPATTLVPGDPSLASRTSRQLLRNGVDYLDNYGDHERALKFLTEAANRPSDLDDAERLQLRQGLDRARKASRDAIVADATAAASGKRPASQPRGRAISRTSPGALVLAPAPSSSSGDPFAAVDPVRQVAAELEPIQEPSPTGLPLLPTPPPSNTSADEAATAPAELPPPLPAEIPSLPVAEPAAAPAAEKVIDPPQAPEPIFLTSSNPEPAPAPSPSPDVVEPPPIVDIDAPAAATEPAQVPAPATIPLPVPMPATSPDVLPLPEPPPLPVSAPVPVPAEAPAPVADPFPAEDALPIVATPIVEPPPLRMDEPSARPTAPPEITNRVPSGPRPQAAAAPRRIAGNDRRSLPPLPPAADATDLELPPLPVLPSASSPIPATGSIAVAPGGASGSSLPQSTLREVEEMARLQDEAMRRNPPENPLGATSNLGSSGGSDDEANASRLSLPRAPSPTEARPIRVIPVPDDFVPLPAREWEPNRKFWAASATCHMPLYFQDAVLERYGQGVEQAMGPAGRFFSYPLDDPRQSNQRNQMLQPLYSSGMFISQLALLPYNMIMDPPWEAQYDLGFYRPGDRVPPDTYYLPKTGIGPPLHGRSY